VNDIGFQVIGPEIIKRPRGGFLAISNRCTTLRIGVIADTEEQAKREFGEIVERWMKERAAELSQQSAH
jgi:hypothetical protein